ncbi:hypothetical protein K9692_004832, partial [Escherichia coli]|nr:hypothetical protein [Escherichia coli]
TIYCDETKILSRTGDVSTILGAMFSSDADALIVYQCQSDADDTWARIGWVELVYRNKGWDVIAGNTENLADALQAATRLIEEMEQKSS